METTELVRLPCDLYQEEYKACTGWRGRFNQYFTTGKYAECSKWHEDFLACSQFIETGDKSCVNFFLILSHFFYKFQIFLSFVDSS